MSDEIPIPFPGPKRAKKLPGGGWIALRGEVVHWEGELPLGKGNCGAPMPDELFVCTRGYEHPSRWHIAGLSNTAAVAVWRGGNP